MAYHNALREADSPERFYSQSLASSDLGKLQLALIKSLSGSELTGIELSNDGSAECISANETQVAAQFACQQLEPSDQHLVIASDSEFIFNWAAIDRGFADPGLGER